jgi:hypothetical protein
MGNEMSLYNTKLDLSMYGANDPESGDQIFERLKQAAGPRSVMDEFRLLVDGTQLGLRILTEFEILWLAAMIDDELRRRWMRARDSGLSEDLFPFERSDH